MRASGRTANAHRDPSRPGRGGDRLDLSIGAIAHRLMRLHTEFARRLAGPPQPTAAQSAPRSRLTSPQAMLGRTEPSLDAYDSFDDESGAVPRPLTYDRTPWREEGGESLAAERSLIRTPRRPAAIAPETQPVPVPVSVPVAPPQPRAASPEGVRFTRTPDPILQQRRQRALEAEREAQRQLEALREAEEAALIAAEAARQAAEEEAKRIAELAAEGNAAAAQIALADALPLWRRPFVPPPGVRFFRTPDRPKSRKRPSAAAPTGPALDWSDVPDWPDLHAWFGAADDASLAYWFPGDAFAALSFAPMAPTSSLSDEMVEALDEETWEDAASALPPPAPVSAMAARAAIRPARSEIVVPTAASPKPVSAEAPSPAAKRPALPLAGRPVLLRTPKPAPAPVEEPEDDEADLLDALEPEPEPQPQLQASSRPRAILPERSTLIPAGRHQAMASVTNEDYELPELELLAEPSPSGTEEVDADELEQNALNLQQTVQDFGVRGDILAVRPGPVVTLYELEPAPGTKSSRVIGLSDDIARSMSAVSARVAVVPGRNVIGIELPNAVRETVYLRELLASEDFVDTKQKLALCLGKNIGGEPIIADLARMPHLLVAGTTGSGKSVAINTMILSLLYRLKPEECRLIMVDPKMLELSVYDGIPHLLSPVVTDPKKAVIALKWAVREMEERYKKMSKVGVRNIDGYNTRMKEAREKGETITRTVQTGFNRETGEAVFADEAMELTALPYIVIVVDEMADLMMVAGKDIEGAIQRLAQMARAAGIHLIMATQRPSVDVITGTIKANFPTRISFQVTSKIDSRTILGEMGAEQLLGQGDMLFMAGGGRTTRVHGPFCSDAEVESVVDHLKRQGRPSYLEAVTADDGTAEPEKGGKGSRKGDKDGDGEEADAPVFDVGAFVAASGGEAADLYEQAIAVVLRDKKASTSYIQRRLQIGYNRAASIMERMEIEGIVGPANHAGKREILVDGVPMPSSGYDDD